MGFERENKMLIKNIDDQHIVWFKNSNSYLILETAVVEIIKKINTGHTISKIESWCRKKLDLPKTSIKTFVSEVAHLINNQNQAIKETAPLNQIAALAPKDYHDTKYYSIHNLCFLVQYETAYHASLIHPKFAHLECQKQCIHTYHYQIFQEENTIFLHVNKQLIGDWNLKNIHFFQGKFSMQIIQHIYQKKEDEWLGVFHASAISNGKNSLLLLGDSGKGKSTALALLQENGFLSLADDFVPIDAINKEAHIFPAAIAIKKNSFKILNPLYPKLKTAIEYRYKISNKTVRYLPTNTVNYTASFPCKALIFINYQKGVVIELNSISKITAFEQLVPDSWISPITTNVNQFLNWFLALPCYQLYYSDTNKMIETVSKIFNDEL